jgi:hypothetical protein
VSLVIVSASAAACSSSDKPPAGAFTGASNIPNGGGDGDASAADADAADAAGADASDASDGGDAGDGADGATAACLGDAVEAGAVDCMAATSPDCTAHCFAFTDHYRGGVANAAAACVLALPSCTGPNASDVIPCADQAIARACGEPSVTSYCDALLAGCGGDPGDAGGPFTKAGCEKFAAALSPAGRDAFAACVTQGTPGSCTPDLVTCIDDIRR